MSSSKGIKQFLLVWLLSAIFFIIIIIVGSGHVNSFMILFGLPILLILGSVVAAFLVGFEIAPLVWLLSWVSSRKSKRKH